MTKDIDNLANDFFEKLANMIDFSEDQWGVSIEDCVTIKINGLIKAIVRELACMSADDKDVIAMNYLTFRECLEKQIEDYMKLRSV